MDGKWWWWTTGEGDRGEAWGECGLGKKTARKKNLNIWREKKGSGNTSEVGFSEICRRQEEGGPEVKVEKLMEEVIKEKESNRPRVAGNKVWEKRIQERGSNTELEIRERVRTYGIQAGRII